MGCHRRSGHDAHQVGISGAEDPKERFRTGRVRRSALLPRRGGSRRAIDSLAAELPTANELHEDAEPNSERALRRRVRRDHELPVRQTASSLAAVHERLIDRTSSLLGTEDNLRVYSIEHGRSTRAPPTTTKRCIGRRLSPQRCRRCRTGTRAETAQTMTMSRPFQRTDCPRSPCREGVSHVRRHDRWSVHLHRALLGSTSSVATDRRHLGVGHCKRCWSWVRMVAA